MSIPNPYASVGVPTPSTTSTTTCVPTYVSITLNAGNSFVLPPGATLVAASDKDLLETDCVDLNGLEEFACYEFAISGACNDDSGDSENWEAARTYINGYYIGSTKYSVTTPDLNFGFSTQACPETSVIDNNFQVSLNETSLNGIIQYLFVDNSAGNCDCGTGNRGWTINIKFKTLPSIANTLMMELRTTALSQEQDPAETIIFIKPKTITCPTTSTTTTAPPQNN